MEGAIESGKITANYILDKYNKPHIFHYKHDDDPYYIKIIQYVDNILYKLYLPNIVKCLIIVIFMFILYKYMPKYIIKYMLKYMCNYKYIKNFVRLKN